MEVYASKSEIAEALIYNNEKMLQLVGKKYVPKEEGMSLISTTTLTAVTNHLTKVDDYDTVPGGSGDGGDNTNIQTELDNYFAGKTAALGTDANGD